MNTRTLMAGCIGFALSCAQSEALGQTLDGSWVVSVNGQSVQAYANGSFRIPNVAAPDQFGAGGPGSSPDFLSDDYLRIIGSSTQSGRTRYLFSSPFRIRQRQTYAVGDLIITETPPPFPQSLRLVASNQTLTRPGQSQPLQAFGRLNDGTEVDVSPQSAWTSYRTSNLGVASINQDGVVTAGRDGVALLTAINEGATAVIRIRVSLGDPLTTVEGFVRREDGSAASGAVVTIVGPGLQGTADASGRFSIVSVPTRDANQSPISTFTLRARLQVGAGALVSNDTPVTVLAGGLTDAGVIVVRSLTDVHGPIIVAGTDPEEHGTAGRQMVKDIIRWVTENSRATHDPPAVLMLGGTTSPENLVRSICNELGYSLTRVTGAGITAANFANYDSLYMPTSVDEISGGLSPADLALINARSQSIFDYLNSGGGVCAFYQSGSGAFAWFPLGALQVSYNVPSSCLQIAPDGASILSASVTGANPYHNLFTGPPGFFGLRVLATECPAPQRALIIGGIGERRRPSPGGAGGPMPFAHVVAQGIEATDWTGNPEKARRISRNGFRVQTIGRTPQSQRAVLTRPDGSTIDLGTLGGASSYATAINSRGQVCGESVLVSGETHAFRWTPDQSGGGSMEDLGTLGGSWSRAAAIAENGDVVGDSAGVDGRGHAFIHRFRSAAARPLVVLSESRSAALTVTESDIVGGWAETNNGEQSASLWIGGGATVHLSELVSSETGWTLHRIEEIRRSKDLLYEVFGTGTLGGESRGFRLTISIKERIQGDLNDDGALDEADLTMLLTNIESGDPCCDLTGDSVVDEADVKELIRLIAGE